MTIDPKITAIVNVLAELKQAYDNNGANPAIQRAIETGVNKAFGQVVAAKHEISAAARAIAKGRHFGQQKYRDVHVGRKNDFFAKTIEIKSKTDTSVGNVDDEIRKGLRQLFGRFKPGRPGDVWVLDVLITNPRNRWPYTGNNQPREEKTFDNFVDTARNRLKPLIEDIANKRFVRFINGPRDVIKEWVSQDGIAHETTIGPASTLFGGRSSRPMVWAQSLDGQDVLDFAKLNALTIKIRWADASPYPLGGHGGNVSAIKFQVATGFSRIAKDDFQLNFINMTRI